MLNKIFKFSEHTSFGILMRKSLIKSLQSHSIFLKINRNYFSTKSESIEQNVEVEPKEESKIQINYNNIKGTKAGDTNHYIIQFTCKKCEFRTTRMFTKRAYHHGIVLIRCEGCEGVHLIADNLGWFEDTSVNVENILERNGEKYKKLSAEGLFQMSTEDVFSQKNSTSNSESIEEMKH